MARPSPITCLAQQLLAYVLQEGSIARSRWPEVVGRLPVFADVVESDSATASSTTWWLRDAVRRRLGHAVHGPQGEKSYGYRHFLDLTSAFTTNPLFVVRHGAKELGYLDPISCSLPTGTSPRSFWLGARGR